MHTNASKMKNVLVTGANRGIGLAIARGLAQRGEYKVIAGARNVDKAEEAANEISNGCEAAVVDLSNPVDIEAQAAELMNELGPIDILINNAGVLLSRAGLDAPAEELVATLMVNTVAPFALIRAIAPGMKTRRWGRIVNLSSGWGSFHEGLGGPAAYSISKAALNALTVTMARELGTEVKINAACPGWVHTDMGGPDAPRTPEEGADTPIWLATLPDDGPTGCFFRNRQEIKW